MRRQRRAEVSTRARLNWQQLLSYTEGKHPPDCVEYDASYIDRRSAGRGGHWFSLARGWRKKNLAQSRLTLVKRVPLRRQKAAEC